MAIAASAMSVISYASAAASVAQGVRQYNISKTNAELVKRRAKEGAEQAREETERLLAAQRLAFVAAGRRAEGGIYNVLASETAEKEAEKARMYAEDMAQQAQNIKNQGMGELLGGVGTGLTQAAKSYETKKQAEI